ncbi:cupin domain-containing protein [Halostella pelagica]|uniref:cupin domain-containing protein n=1 Tax=Halostella pelagica TaxID=2583824 RepID=UPI0010812F1A|nr:cupin domain-containing protein [Halostella pelagica]
MGTIIGRPLDENGEPTDGRGIEVEPNGPAADLLRNASRPLVSSPGLGQWFSLLRTPDENSDERPAILLWLAPDATALPPHRHPDEAEYFRTVEGEITVVVEGEPQRLGPGEEVTVQPGQSHSFRNDTDDFVATYVELPWMKTAETLCTVCGKDHDGEFGTDGGYGEPGFVHGLVMAEAIREGTKIPSAPFAVQRVLWATVGRVAKAFGHCAVDKRYLRDEFWEATVEQPDL